MTNPAVLARKIRLRVLELCSQKNSSHIGGAFSVADVLSVLYSGVLEISPSTVDDPSRDRLFFSKGHASAALYSAMELRGFFEGHDLLEEFTENGSYFTSHISHKLHGVEHSTGSLGHALGVACGSALASKRRKLKNTVFAVLSDGELDEGSNWEAILFAAHNKLDNLIAVIDYNKIQSFGTVEEVMNLEPLAAKFQSFNWEVEEVDGHSTKDLHLSLMRFKASRSGRPKCLIAHTVKGKGVSFMENELAWHYKSPSIKEARMAREELESR